LIVKDSPFASLLMKISSTVVSYFDPPHNFRGCEIPLLDETILKYKIKSNVFRASKTVNPDGSICFWGNKHSYSLWNEEPQYFDYID
jgi:hypothetical protein